MSAIARQARVDRTFLYRHRDLLALVHAAALEPAGQDPAGATPVDEDPRWKRPVLLLASLDPVLNGWGG
ncbi:hypothetical protein ABIA33_001493 [Streptacidiphilus sp. MAP12-16]|uniref:hypothetical protein n=1 Tax=Streptacidiphilus sp. MAP12-16 TaxID=3156300 RepID=UPI00351879D9